MACARCDGELDERSGPAGWCAACERAYDAWSRRHASDIVYSALSGTVVVIALSLGIPLLGAEGIAAIAGVFAGFGTLLGVHRWNRRRRRRQFLRGAAIPRAYLPVAQPRDS